MAYMRGALPSPRHKLAAAKPHKAVPAPSVYAAIPPQLSMWGNDKYGDCVSAEEAAAKAVYSVANGQPELFITESEVETWARQHGFLNGADLTSVMEAMAKSGMTANGATYDDGPYSSVDWTEYPTLCSAIFQGPVKIGVAASQLENAVNTTNGGNGWWLTKAKTDRSYDHCVGLVGYGEASACAEVLKVSVPVGIDPTTPCVLLFTWSSIGIVTLSALVAITGEAWLRNPTTTTTPAPGPGPNHPCPRLRDAITNIGRPIPDAADAVTAAACKVGDAADEASALLAEIRTVIRRFLP